MFIPGIDMARTKKLKYKKGKNLKGNVSCALIIEIFPLVIVHVDFRYWLKDIARTGVWRTDNPNTK